MKKTSIKSMMAFFTLVTFGATILFLGIVIIANNGKIDINSERNARMINMNKKCAEVYVSNYLPPEAVDFDHNKIIDGNDLKFFLDQDKKNCQIYVSIAYHFAQTFHKK